MADLKDEVYEVDADPDRIDEEMTRSQADSITKQGYLLKGPDSNSDRMFAHITTRPFKRRYCYLRQEIDGTYMLELHKDEKQCEAKATIVMDFCTDVVLNPKRGKNCFELRMTAGHKSFLLAAENETEMQDWLSKLQSVLHQNKLREDRSASLDRAINTPNTNSQMFGTLKGLDQSMNPQLMKYGRETDATIAQARQEHRRKLFTSYSPLHKSGAVNDIIDLYREQFGHRLLVKCQSLKFRLQTPNEANDSDVMCQAEPYFTSFALYDAKAGTKLTENFYFDVNEDIVIEMSCGGSGVATSNGYITNGEAKCAAPMAKEFDSLPKDWLKRPRQAILSVTKPHSDIFIVVKVDKILQGSINTTTEPYLKAVKDPKMGQKLHKNVSLYCQKIGQYRMPFAWTARPLFRLYSNEVDSSVEFPAIYRQDANKLKDEDLLKLLSEYRKPDKFSKLTVIPGNMKISVESIQELPNSECPLEIALLSSLIRVCSLLDCLTTTLMPLKPFPMPPPGPPSLEVTEFTCTPDRDLHPFTTFVNHLFLYPLCLSFDSQKLFSRARNIAVLIELRDSDNDAAKPIPCIYGRPGQSTFLTRISCPVLHHNTVPTWQEEIKIRLPLTITAQHHLLFSFVHVSCDLSKKRDAGCSFESPVGFAWMPLLVKGKINIDEQILSVAASLPSGYLAIQPLGLGRGVSRIAQT